MQSDVGLHCLPRPVFLKTQDHLYGIKNQRVPEK